MESEFVLHYVGVSDRWGLFPAAALKSRPRATLLYTVCHGKYSFSVRRRSGQSRVKKALVTETVATPWRKTSRSGWKLRFFAPPVAEASRQSRVKKALVTKHGVSARVSQCRRSRRRLWRKMSNGIKNGLTREGSVGISYRRFVFTFVCFLLPTILSAYDFFPRMFLCFGCDFPRLPTIFNEAVFVFVALLLQ